MSFINKVKNFFYEDVEEDDEEFEAREKAKREERHKKEEEKRRRHHEQDIVREIKEQKKLSKPANDDLSELELFRSEKTFNFPDLGDDIFDVGDEPVIEEEKRETRSTIKEEKNLYAKPSRQEPVPSIRTTYKERPKVEEDNKKFHPSPVVSPVYGILDKNYTVDDVVDKNLSKTKEFSIEKKSVDFDTVRNRAYKELDEEIEATLTKTKDIFYNLDEKKEEVEEPIEDYIEEEYDKDENNIEDEVVITYEGEEEKDPEKEELAKLVEEIKVDGEESENYEEQPDEDVEEDLTPDVAISTIKEESLKEKKTRRSKIVEAEKESDDEEKEEKEDLFNLIDNMYNEEEDEEEED